jgi:putative restriction endonuclease
MLIDNGVPKSYARNVYSALNKYKEFMAIYSSKSSDSFLLSTKEPETSKQQLINSRIGHSKFREDLIKKYKTCSVTGFKDTSLLIASHIKPWKISNSNERLDKHNGLLLTPNLDKLFDRGLITFLDNGEIQVSKNLESPSLLGIHESIKLIKPLSHETKSYMQYHRNEVFKNGSK